MNNRTIRRSLGSLAVFCLAAWPVAAAEVQLSVIQFPERSSVDIDMAGSVRVVPAKAEASVKYKDGQAQIEVDSKNLPPAIVFGGDVTSYVAWAVSRDGNAENLGELIVRGTSGSGEYRTGQKEFALLVTAEPYALVLKPSELVCFMSVAPPQNKVRSTLITFSGFVAAPALGNPQIGALRYAGKEPVEIVQAQHVLDQAKAIGADKYSPDALREAEITLNQATNLFKSGDKRTGVDYASRSRSISSTAIRDAQKRRAEQAAADAAAGRAAEMQSLEKQRVAAQAQAASAEKQALEAREQALAAREQALAAQQQLTTLQEQAAAAQQEATAAQQRAAAAGLSAEAADAARREADEARLKAEGLAAQLKNENERLVRERDDLAGQLDGALSSVAQITKTARGVVVNLPDILFDVNKATLKQNTQVALAKLAGIVQLFPKINLRIEGHTDSTGSDELNMRLSKERAESVLGFLQGQGVASSRLTAMGYGPKVPVADNATPEGRAKNRRVEIVLAEGVIQGAGN